MNHTDGIVAAQEAQIAALKGKLAESAADVGHLKAALRCRLEREWAGERRVISSITGPADVRVDETGFCPGGLI